MVAPRGSSQADPAVGVVLDATVSIPIPASFLSEIAPLITSIEELQVMLTVFRLAALRLEGSPRAPDRRISRGIELSLARGTLIRLFSSHGRKQATWYYLNTPENRATIRLMESGQLPAPRSLWPDDEPPSITVDRPNAFRLYEQNIGPLTPLIADQIARAIERYPDDWIEDAMSEAVAYNRRSWRYVSRILENWQAEGRRDGDS
jgi:DNA replication protein